ncbi:flagellar motor protein MotA [candidate division LCP-89 bacterium B3_LCP]|uniref:Flagellar motor protein MotA n=1 Tax=candidate division LCP-89 bacterium B3_LCP TaxID=2012998 RepID=A0A532UXP6_UNCL8|nr:MAG: flagellar motor protein MotA [candidate division LCP-89 bacterium B3_LCP]
MVELFLNGGPFMWPILALFIFGLMFTLERLWTLTRATVNTRKFVLNIRQAMTDGGVDAALEVCANTRGPVASVLHAGLMRFDRGLDHVEKAIMTSGSIEMAFLEKNLVWLSTVIAIAPMLGFTGTVSGMIKSFEDIAKANDISPSIVASGISEALLTTLFGLIVAMIIQVFHNYFVSRVDKLVIDMEEATVELVDYIDETQRGDTQANAG